MGGGGTSDVVDFACSESLLKFDDPAVIARSIQMLPVIRSSLLQCQSFV
jgi:hypothetical protein